MNKQRNQRGATPRPTPDKSALTRLRETITLDALRFEIEKGLQRADRSADEWTVWPTSVLAQIRISRADLKGSTSESPERQLRQIARYCIAYQLSPTELCFEAQSGHLTDAMPRRKFEEVRRRIEAGALEVDAVVTYNIDRFTRDKLIGEEWFKTLRNRGVDLYEADEMEPPRSLEKMEDEYTRKLHGAWRESRRTSKRVRDAHADMAESGRLVSGFGSKPFGHDFVLAENESGVLKRVGLRVDEHEARWLQEASQRLDAGANLHSIVVDFHARGLKVTYQTLKRQLVAPRMCGMQTVSGELKRADIEPILTREQWDRNRELLAPKPRGGYRQHPLTGKLICGTCGDRMAGGCANGTGRAHYRCLKRAQRYQRNCQCGKPNGRCRCAALRGGRIAVDGLRHPTRGTNFVERFVAEIIRMAHDADRVAAHADDLLQASQAFDGRIAEITASREDLISRRRQIASLVARGLVDESDVQTELADLAKALAEAEAGISRLAAIRRERERRVSPEEFTRLLNTEGPAYLRAQADNVIDHLVLHPVSDTHSPYSGIEPHFVDGYSVPKPLLEELADQLNQEWQAERRALCANGQQMSAELEERIYTMWSSSDLLTTDIAARLTTEQIPTPAGKSKWHANTVAAALKRACGRRGIDYVPRRRTPAYPQETRSAIYELCRDQRPFAAVIEDLERMGILPPNAKSWTPMYVRSIYASECARRGTKPVGRKSAIAPEVKRRVRVLLRAEGKTAREAADWLNSAGISRPNGGRWTKYHVYDLLRREEEEL